MHVLSGDRFNQEGIVKAFATPPENKIDLFVCEFHHNISIERQSYKPENVLGQVKAMIQQGLVADKLTIAIDNTINLEQSEEVKAFLADETIKHLIQLGKLNVVLLRSAQKFDMLGMDNYYGGITTSLNESKAFSKFNARMAKKEDQLAGLSYQGLAHLQKYGGKSLDNYRLLTMKNTQKLYKMLPDNAIYHKGTDNPMQISEIADDQLVFLDIKFPEYPKAADAFKQRFLTYAKEKNYL